MNLRHMKVLTQICNWNKKIQTVSQKRKEKIQSLDGIGREWSASTHPLCDLPAGFSFSTAALNSYPDCKFVKICHIHLQILYHKHMQQQLNCSSNKQGCYNHWYSWRKIHKSYQLDRCNYSYLWFLFIYLSI